MHKNRIAKVFQCSYNFFLKSILLMIRLNLWYFDGDSRGYIVFLAAGALVDYILKLPGKKSLNIFVTSIIQKIDLYSCLQFPPHDQVTGFELLRDQLCGKSNIYRSIIVNQCRLGLPDRISQKSSKKFNSFKTVATLLCREKEEIYRKKDSQKG